METKQANLGLTIEPGSEPISGQVRLPDGSTTAFEGYVQLIAAIERAHDPDAAASPDAGAREAGRATE